jgi:peptide/nickel transport system substrate-binding protein
MFMVDSVAPDRVVLAANPGYWGAKPYLEKIEFWFYGDEDGLLVDYERGDVDGFHLARPDSLASLSGLPALQLYTALSARYGIVYLNLARDSVPFFQETGVRQALLLALDRQALIDEVLSGQGLVADSPVLPTVWAHDPSVRQYQYDPERAKGLLDAGGWLDTDADGIRDKDDVPLAFTLLTGDEPTMVKMAEKIVGAWAEIGIDATMQSTSASRAPDLIRRRSYDAALAEFPLVADPDPYPFWHSTQARESGQNFAGFANEQADLILEEGRLTVDQGRRQELYSSFQQIFAEEVPSLLLYYPVYAYAVDDRVQNVQLAPMLHSSDRFRNVSDWYMETTEVVVSESEQLDKPEE